MKRVLTWALLGAAALLTAAPEVWNGPVPLPERNPKSTRTRTEPLYVVTVLYRNLPFSVNSGTMLSELQKQYRAAGVQIYGVLGDDLAAVRRFAAEHPDFDFTLAADPELKTLAALTGGRNNAFSRAAIVNADGKLLWSGDPVDLGMMLKRITLDQYSEHEEAQLAELNTALQAALRSGNSGLIEQAADRLLAARPEQISALNAKAFALENRRDYRALADFLKKRIRRNPEMPEAWYMLLDLSCRVPELSPELAPTAQGYFRQFPEDCAGINAVVWNLLNNAPMQSAALRLAGEGLALLRTRESSIAPERRSRYLACRALFAYRVGRLETAAELADEAVKTAGSAAEKAYLGNLADYFRTALKLAQSAENK